MSRWHSLLHRWAMPGSAMVTAIALAVIFLVVVPGFYGGGRAEAQPPSAPSAGGGAGGGGMMMPPGGGSMPMMGGGMGGPPGMGSSMPMMGGAGGAGAGAAAPGGGAAAAAPKKEVKPFEPYRENPFLPLQGGGPVTPRWYRYGPRWTSAPIGLVLQGLPRPARPAPKAPPPPPAPIEKILRVSSIAWAGGQPMATYEMPDGKTGIVKPGEFIGDWQVIEILRDRIKVRNRKTGQEQEVFLRPKEKLPKMPTAAGGAAGAAGGRRLPAPMMGPGGMPPGMGPPGEMGPGAIPMPGMPAGEGPMVRPGVRGGLMAPGAGGALRPGAMMRQRGGK